MPPRTVRGQTVIVTGATSGIGRETALAFSRAGANIVAAGRREERLKELVGEIEARGGQALAAPTDVAEQAQVEALIEKAAKRFNQIDVLVNNAGVGIAAPFEEQSIEDFRRVMEVNFWGAVYACKAAVPLMRAQKGGGLIVNVSSIMGKRGVPFETAYCASKFALAGFSEALRTEVMSAGIDVTTVFPGAVESEIWDSASNQTGMEMPNAFPKFPATELARILVQNTRLPQPEIVLSMDAQALNFLNTIAPRAMDFFLGQSAPFVEGLRGNARASGPNAGNLYRPARQQRKPESEGPP